MTSWFFSQDGEYKKCLQNFGAESVEKMFSWKIMNEVENVILN
jgi:hypothetical protein